MDKKNQENNRKKDEKKPLRLSSAGRLQLRKNLGPDQVKSGSSGKKSKTIQIVFKKKTSSQKNKALSQTKGFKKPYKIKSPSLVKPSEPILVKNDKFKKSVTKKSTFKRPKIKTLNPNDEKGGKVNISKVLELEEQEFDKLPSLAKIKRAREKEKLKAIDS